MDLQFNLQKELLQVERIWVVEMLCKQKLAYMERAIKLSFTQLTANPRHHLHLMEKYIDECLKELNDIKAPCNEAENFGTFGENKPLKAQAMELIYETTPRLTQHLTYVNSKKPSEFAVNHYFQKVLILCKRCIELDIECFRLLEIIFGFEAINPLNATTKRFYDICGLSADKSSRLDLTAYGFGEFSKIKQGTHQSPFVVSKKETFYFDANRYEMMYYKQYPYIEYKYCCDQNISFFRMANINFFGIIGGFDAILKRITNTKCCVGVSDLVNLLRPMALLRDLLSRRYYEIQVHNIQNALFYYYENMPLKLMNKVVYKTAQKSFKNLHYMMNNDFDIKLINEIKTKLRLQLLFRYLLSPYIAQQIIARDQITALIDEWFRAENVSMTLLITIKTSKKWIERYGIIDTLLNKQLITGLSSIYNLLCYDNDSLDLTKHVVPFICYMLQSSDDDDELPLDLKQIYFANCKSLIYGYYKEYLYQHILVDIAQVILCFCVSLKSA